jgi:nucleoid-associated protein YejK
MPYILHIERKVGKQKYKFKMEVPSPTRKDAIEQFNKYADRHDGETILISCRLLREDMDPDDPDGETIE